MAKEASAPDTQAKEECFLGGHFLAFTLFFLGWGDEKLFLALSQCGFFWGIRRREKERKKGVLSPLFFFSLPPLIQSLPSHLSKFLRMIADCATPPTHTPPTTPLFPACGRKKKHFFRKIKLGRYGEIYISIPFAFGQRTHSRILRRNEKMRIFGKGSGVYRILRECCIFPRREVDSLSAPLFSIFFERQQKLSRKIVFLKSIPAHFDFTPKIS